MVHAEVVLQRDGGVGLRSRLDLDPFLGLDGLVKTVRVATTAQHTTRVLVHDHDFAFLHDVFGILLEQDVGLEELFDGVQTSGRSGIIRVHLPFLLDELVLEDLEVVVKLIGPLLFRQRIVRFQGLLDFALPLLLRLLHLDRQFAEVGHDEQAFVLTRRTTNKLPALLGHFDGSLLLLVSKVQLLIHDGHVLGVVLQVQELRPLP